MSGLLSGFGSSMYPEKHNWSINNKQNLTSKVWATTLNNDDQIGTNEWGSEGRKSSGNYLEWWNYHHRWPPGFHQKGEWRSTTCTANSPVPGEETPHANPVETRRGEETDHQEKPRYHHQNINKTFNNSHKNDKYLKDWLAWRCVSLTNYVFQSYHSPRHQPSLW